MTTVFDLNSSPIANAMKNSSWLLDHKISGSPQSFETYQFFYIIEMYGHDII